MSDEPETPDLDAFLNADDVDEWAGVKAGLSHQFVIVGMGFLEHNLCPDIRYDDEIAKVICVEVYPEVQRLAEQFVERLAQRVDTLAELHYLSHRD